MKVGFQLWVLEAQSLSLYYYLLVIVLFCMWTTGNLLFSTLYKWLELHTGRSSTLLLPLPINLMRSHTATCLLRSDFAATQAPAGEPEPLGASSEKGEHNYARNRIKKGKQTGGRSWEGRLNERQRPWLLGPSLPPLWLFLHGLCSQSTLQFTESSFQTLAKSHTWC